MKLLGSFLIIMALGVFAYAQPLQRYQLAITEVMADPSPQVGLPNAEYIELTNLSGTPVDLFGFRISDATNTASINQHFLLLPDSMVILCSNGNVPALSPFGKAIGVNSFPSLDNDGDLLVLRSPSFVTIHVIAYQPDWYSAPTKKEGGWSLEMIDTRTPCSGRSNWKASVHQKGGTPGKPNSVTAVNTDETPPELIRSFSIDSVTTILIFSETLDSNSAVSPTDYKCDRSTILKALPLSPLFNQVKIQFATPLPEKQVYTITVNNIKDCSGNTIGSFNQTKAGKPSFPAKKEVVINEILFNPRSDGYDYVEIYNNSAKLIDISDLYIGSRDINRSITPVKQMHTGPFYIFPGEYIVLTPDADNLALNYLVKDRNRVLELSLPSFADDKGDVVLLDSQGGMVDELNYKDDWQFALITDPEGVALERVDPSDSTNNQSNWHSAAATAGYGTPGYKNSQFRMLEEVEAEISLSAPLFSPDNDGIDDLVFLQYSAEGSGFLANVHIFDIRGEPVKHLVKNELLGINGKWKWDGLDENKQKLPAGSYIVLVEMFNLTGKRKTWKKLIVLARKTS